jgi:hypothetical protein
VTRIIIAALAAPLLALLPSCDKNSTTLRVTELYCLPAPNDAAGKLRLLDANYACKYGHKVGSDLEFTINPAANTVLVDVVRNDGNWGSTHFFLENCKVADATNWECENKVQFFQSQAPVVTINGMSHGTYYRSVTDELSTDYYQSSLTGFARALYASGWLAVDDAIALNIKLKSWFRE